MSCVRNMNFRRAMKKFVSIIIPAYNAEKTIKRCIDSIINQSYHFLQIIIIDDGSKDRTQEIINNYNDKRIEYFFQNNAGVSTARNVGISHAKSEYIIFVDADDTLPLRAIEIMVDCMRSNSAQLAAFSYEIRKSFNRKDYYYLNDIIYNETFDYEGLSKFVDTVPNAPWGKVFLKSVIIDNNILFDVNVPYAEDTIFLINYITHINTIVLSSKIVYNYYYYDGLEQACRKYYPNLFEYLNKVMKAKENYCILHHTTYIKDEDIKRYLDELICHCILNENYNSLDRDLGALGISDDKDSVVKKWRKTNWKKCLKYYIKIFVKHFM